MSYHKSTQTTDKPDNSLQSSSAPTLPVRTWTSPSDINIASQSDTPRCFLQPTIRTEHIRVSMHSLSRFAASALCRPADRRWFDGPSRKEAYWCRMRWKTGKDNHNRIHGRSELTWSTLRASEFAQFCSWELRSQRTAGRRIACSCPWSSASGSSSVESRDVEDGKAMPIDNTFRGWKC